MWAFYALVVGVLRTEAPGTPVLPEPQPQAYLATRTNVAQRLLRPAAKRPSAACPGE